jgi:hypothetical protein
VAAEGNGGSRAAKSWRVEGGASFGKREGVQRINPLARAWAGVRPSGAGKESARSAKNFGQGQPARLAAGTPKSEIRDPSGDWVNSASGRGLGRANARTEGRGRPSAFESPTAVARPRLL